MAAHSSGATTARKSPSRTTCAPAMPAMELSSTTAGTDPATGGRTTRAWSMPGRLTCTQYSVVASTLPAMSLRATGLPTTW